MKITMLAIGLLLTASVAPALCAEKAKPSNKKAVMNITPAQREQMATNHEKMATCLRSDSAIEACHKEMMESCKGMGTNCPMMGKMHGMMGRGMMHDHGKIEEEKSEENDKK